MDTWDNIASILDDLWTGMQIAGEQAITPPGLFITIAAVAVVAGLVAFLIWWNHR